MPERRYPIAECVELEDRQPMFWIHLTDAEAQAIARGTVPAEVRQALADMIRWRIDDPMTWPKRKAGAGGRRTGTPRRSARRPSAR